MFLQKLRMKRKYRVRILPVNLISVPTSPLSAEDEDKQHTLEISISKFGMLSPLIVRRTGFRRWELVCGSRRLKAANSCGMKAVPCIVVFADDMEAEKIRLSESLSRHEWDFLETASALKELTYSHGVPLDDASLCSGLTLRQTASLMHILSMPKAQLIAMRSAGFGCEHALQLLRINDDKTRETAICDIAFHGLGSQQTERYVSRLLRGEEPASPRQTYVVKDVRMFLNSINRGLDIMRGSGIDADLLQEDSDNCTKLTIRIPQNNEQRKVVV